MQKTMLPLQGADWFVDHLTQGVAIGLEYIGPSARKKNEKNECRIFNNQYR
jgi:hypothetical protein